MGEFEKKTLRDKYDEARQRELKELLDPYFSERPDHFNLSPREVEVIGDIICRLDLGYRIFMFAQKL